MSLEVAKLEKVRELAGGLMQARCPACAEGGHDRSGEHLRIYPDGRFGCCVHPKDGEHRKRIWALAGCKLHLSPAGSVSLRLKVLAHGHHSTAPAARSVKAALTAVTVGTLGTGKSESVCPVANPAAPAELNFTESGTLGTPKVELRARARVDSTTANIDKVDFHVKLEDLETSVPSVPVARVLEPLIPTSERLPFLTAGGTLSIPFDSPERYHWWKPDGERLSVAATLQEVRAALAIKKG